MTAVSASERRDAPPLRRLLISLGLLWLAGAALRMTVLAVPPLLPLIHGDLDLFRHIESAFFDIGSEGFVDKDLA